MCLLSQFAQINKVRKYGKNEFYFIINPVYAICVIFSIGLYYLEFDIALTNYADNGLRKQL